VVPSAALKGGASLLSACLAALAGRDVSEIARSLSAVQRQSGALAGEVAIPEFPPLVATAVAVLLFGAPLIQGAVANALRNPSERPEARG
jgi:hypothetical protein